ncbi:hypothetical protein D3876_16575 [Sphingomonas cavernae]|uniref:Uncharacterized protein n=2 Tax=Sphingomonas cavernae TaxID=2320861 RepID=A0A418W689_9SPHN|nr:hypothetical protein D3876_16575 [Sphingomonas cavernae]
MRRIRDHKKEYARRIANAAKRGLSRSQARGHARSGEASIRSASTKDAERLEAAYKALRQSGNQSAAAKSAGIAPERLRRFLRENALVERRGRSWKFTDDRLRQMTVISEGERRSVSLRGFDQASLNGQHLAAVQAFLTSNDIGLLLPFAGRAVIDAKGGTHPLETDPNALHRLAAAGSEQFLEIYRLIQ